MATIAIVDVPVRIAGVEVMVSVMGTGVAGVGLTVVDGEKLQVAPEGRPVQDNVTVPLKLPAAVT